MIKAIEKRNLIKLVKEVFGSEAGKELLEVWYKKEVLVSKYHELPHLMAAKTARADFVLDIMRAANLPPEVLDTYQEQLADPQQDDRVQLIDDGFFPTNEDFD